MNVEIHFVTCFSNCLKSLKYQIDFIHYQKLSWIIPVYIPHLKIKIPLNFLLVGFLEKSHKNKISQLQRFLRSVSGTDRCRPALTGLDRHRQARVVL
jgi:hypothetical protein